MTSERLLFDVAAVDWLPAEDGPRAEVATEAQVTTDEGSCCWMTPEQRKKWRNNGDRERRDIRKKTDSVFEQAQ